MFTVPNCVIEKPFTIIAINGSIGCGKNYVAEHFIVPWALSKGRMTGIFGFADPLKIESLMAKEVTFETAFVQKTTESRIALQSRGVRMRETVSESYWIQQLHYRIVVQIYYGARLIIIPDLRFGNEFEYLQTTFPKQVRFVRIEAPERSHFKCMQEYAQYDENGVLNLEKTTEMIKHIMNHASEVESKNFNNYHLVLKNDFQDEDRVEDVVLEFLEKNIV